MLEDDLQAYEAIYNPKARGQQPPRVTDARKLIVYEDQDYMVLNKPPLIATLDERAEGFGLGLLRLVKQHYPEAQAAHRLDKETSGCVAFAKNPEAYRHLAMQFEHRQVSKVYHAVSSGLHKFEGIRVYLPISIHRGGYASIDKLEGKEAETIVNTLKVYKRHTLIECMPITGRLHQIRVHLAALKAPIVQDEDYGGEPAYLSQVKRNFRLKEGTTEQPLIQRVALHAYRLNFAGLDEVRIDVQSPYPKDLEALITQLEKNM